MTKEEALGELLAQLVMEQNPHRQQAIRERIEFIRDMPEPCS